MVEAFYDKINDYGSVTIKLASPEDIRSWSYGEVKKPETINYRTYRAEKDGLFCERIFGPERDWECYCGKYKGIKHKGIVCDRCGVKVIHSRVRRKRMGHINLASPVAHIWFFKAMPSRMGTLLAMKTSALEKVIYFQDYVVIDPGDTQLKKQELLTEEKYRECRQKFGDRFRAGMGAEAVKELLTKLDLPKLSKELREELSKTNSKQRQKEIIKRLKTVEMLIGSNNRPEWMILEVIPVIPPDLRPLVLLDSGNFATSDLNDLYRRLINRNNRLKKLLDLNAPEVIIRNEKRMLQQSVDALFDNSRCRRPVVGSGNRPLKSLTDMIKGKQGRFRENLLGKRVDYSARSVIVVGPELKLHQCGLPKKIALELFQPFIIRRLKELGYADTIKSAKKMLEKKDKEVWDILEDVIHEHPVLLNRAPTLHRMGIQAFEPILIEGNAIKIHPLVCAGFNADFDGDQMAVHLPLSIEAQVEATSLMLSTNNIFSPANGKPIIAPSQDIVLGCYYLTVLREQEPNKLLFVSDSGFSNSLDAEKIPDKLFKEFENKNTTLRTPRVKKIKDGWWNIFDGEEKYSIKKEDEKLKVYGIKKWFMNSPEEVFVAHSQGKVSYHTHVDLRLEVDIKVIPAPPFSGSTKGRRIHTTVGRIFFNEMLPEGMPFYNMTLDKKALNDIIDDCYHILGRRPTLALLDEVKELGFKIATLGGLSFAKNDLRIPTAKERILEQTQKAVNKKEDAYKEGLISEQERYLTIIDLWTHAREMVGEEMMRELKNDIRDGIPYLNPVFLMADSGARGSQEQVRQLAGMRGLMAKPSGKIIETPITANFREGLKVLEYFSSTHGARKGLADTALKTADSGYLTRKLADVAQNVVINEEDCGTMQGITKGVVKQGEKIVVPLWRNIRGRVARDTLYDKSKNPPEIIVKENDLITEVIAKRIESLGYEKIRVRSPLVCETPLGICSKCYGMDLSRGKPVEMGLAVGIIAAQSIGEPGTQLTMRTFHIGGIAVKVRDDPEIKCRRGGRVKFSKLSVVKNKRQRIALNAGEIIITNPDNPQEEYEKLPIPLGSFIKVNEDEVIEGDSLLAKFDPHNTPTLSEMNGIVYFDDVELGVTMKHEEIHDTGKASEAKSKKRVKVIIEHKGEKHPSIIIQDKEGKKTLAIHSLPEKARIEVEEGEEVFPGSLLAKTPREITGTQDITGGLPRVTEILEARRPKNPAVVSEIDGKVILGEKRRGKRTIIVRPEKAEQHKGHEHLVPHGRRILVRDGDIVKAGQALVDGPLVPHDILRVCGQEELQRYLLQEIQNVYRSQNVNIDDKHIEIILSQMLRKVRVENPGDTEFLPGSVVDKFRFHRKNQETTKQGLKPATFKPLLLGITKASLQSDSFISAASFQETTKVLTEAALAGKRDDLLGLKENVILGHMVPAGTGFKAHHRTKVKKNVDPELLQKKEEEAKRIRDKKREEESLL